VRFQDMLVGDDYAWASGSRLVRVTLLRTPADLRAGERVLVRFRDGRRKGEAGAVSIHDLIYHWKTGAQRARPVPIPQPKPPGVRRRVA
jgi:hypothetical protein